MDLALGTRDGVAVLRERLLRDVSRDRRRSPVLRPYTQVTHGVTLASSRQSAHTSTQTDVDLGVPSATALSGPEWTDSDERSQREAIRALHHIATRCGDSLNVNTLQARLKAAECALDASVTRCAQLQAEAEQERRRCKSSQEQVMCLEHELDSKEAAVQAVERALERKDADLQRLQLKLLTAQAAATGKPEEVGLTVSGRGWVSEEAQIKALKGQLDERERQIALKDHHITRLMTVLRQNRGVGEEDPALCASEILSTTTRTTSASTGRSFITN